MTRNTRLTSSQSLATLTRINRYNLRPEIRSIRLLNSLVCVDPRRKVSILALCSVNPRLPISVVLFIPRLIYLSYRRIGTSHLSLASAVTNKSKLSSAEKNTRRFPEQRKAGFLRRDLWRPLAQLTAAMSRSVVNILADS